MNDTVKIKRLTADETVKINPTVKQIALDLRKKLLEESTDTGGLCLEASCRLCYLLKEQQFNPKLVRGEVVFENRRIKFIGGHFWVDVDQNIVDITGDQFNQLLSYIKLPNLVYGSYEHYPMYKPLRVEDFSLYSFGL